MQQDLPTFEQVANDPSSWARVAAWVFLALLVVVPLLAWWFFFRRAARLIPRWHWGKLAIVWVISGAATWFIYDLLNSASDAGPLLAIAVGPALVLTPIVATWTWLSARETGRSPPPAA